MLECTGWARSVGGANPYLTLFARTGVSRAEIDRLRAAVLDAVRNLGEAGKKKGLTTTLPVALGLLQASGEPRRVPADGRLDQQRYSYARWSAPNSGAQRGAS